VEKMPKVILMTEKGVVIECEYLPQSGQSKADEQAAEELASKVCRPRCGYYNDAMLKKINIACMHPASPHLAQIKKQIATANQP
jgi:hypothetical protein